MAIRQALFQDNMHNGAIFIHITNHHICFCFNPVQDWQNLAQQRRVALGESLRENSEVSYVILYLPTYPHCKFHMKNFTFLPYK